MANVSVVTAVYNTHENYLRECFDSILSQSYDDLELIIVDDGSDAYIRDICCNYVLADRRVRYFYQNNQGCSVARNFGLVKSVGEYILFVDHDDFLDRFYIEKMYKSVTSGKFDASLNSSFVDSHIKNLGAFITFSAMIRRDFLLRHSDVRFPPGVQPCEDGIFSHKLLAYTNNISICYDATYYWRRHPGQASTVINNDVSKLLNMIEHWILLIEKFYIDNDFFNSNPSKKRHFLRFLENEPFLIRYNKTFLNILERKKLYSIIKVYVDKYDLFLYLDDSFNKKFKKLVLSKSFFHFYVSRFHSELKRDLKKIIHFFREGFASH